VIETIYQLTFNLLSNPGSIHKKLNEATTVSHGLQLLYQSNESNESNTDHNLPLESSIVMSELDDEDEKFDEVM